MCRSAPFESWSLRSLSTAPKIESNSLLDVVVGAVHAVFMPPKRVVSAGRQHHNAELALLRLARNDGASAGGSVPSSSSGLAPGPEGHVLEAMAAEAAAAINAELNDDDQELLDDDLPNDIQSHMESGFDDAEEHDAAAWEADLPDLCYPCEGPVELEPEAPIPEPSGLASSSASEPRVPDGPAPVCSVAELAAATVEGPTGEITCPLPPFADFGPIGRCSDWPADKEPVARSQSMRCWLQRGNCAVAKSRKVSQEQLIRWLVSGELPCPDTRAERLRLSLIHRSKWHDGI